MANRPPRAASRPTAAALSAPARPASRNSLQASPQLPAKPAVPHLHRDRHGTYYYRITEAGRTVKRSLRTKNAELATIRAACLNWEFDAMSRSREPTVDEIAKALRGGSVRKYDVEVTPEGGRKFTNVNSEDDHRRVTQLLNDMSIGAIAPRAAAPTYPAVPVDHSSPGPKLLAATASYVKELRKVGAIDEKSIVDMESTYAAFAALHGDPHLRRVDSAMVLAFKDKALDNAGGGRVNTKVGHLSQFYAWAIKHAMADLNPFAEARIETVEAVESYVHFTQDDLDLIFNPATYLEYARKPHYHWMPFLLLHTGARADEIASLRVDQFQTERGVRFIQLKAAKNTNSIRKIPLHKRIRESAFMDYLDARVADDPKGQLFPELKPGKNGHAKNVSRRFNESYLPQLRIDDPTKRLHSFRATFINRLVEENANAGMLMAIVGHYHQAQVDLSSAHFKSYQKGSKLITALQETVDMFDLEIPMSFKSVKTQLTESTPEAKSAKKTMKTRTDTI